MTDHGRIFIGGVEYPLARVTVGYQKDQDDDFSLANNSIEPTRFIGFRQVTASIDPHTYDQVVGATGGALIVDLEYIVETGERDPFYEQPPWGIVAVARWCWRVFSYSVRDAAGRVQRPKKFIYNIYHARIEPERSN